MRSTNALNNFLVVAGIGLIAAIIAIYFILALILGWPPFSTSPPANVQIVLDRSSVMEDPLGDGTKLEAAVRAIQQTILVHEVTADNNLSFRQYGGACGGDNTQLLVEFGPGNQDSVRNALQEIETAGQSTFVDGIIQAIRDFSESERRDSVHNEIIVVAGGGDACQIEDSAARINGEIEELGVQVKIRFIGLDVPLDQRDRLDELALAISGELPVYVSTQLELEERLTTIGTALADAAQGLPTQTPLFVQEAPTPTSVPTPTPEGDAAIANAIGGGGTPTPTLPAATPTLPAPTPTSPPPTPTLPPPTPTLTAPTPTPPPPTPTPTPLPPTPTPTPLPPTPTPPPPTPTPTPPPPGRPAGDNDDDPARPVNFVPVAQGQAVITNEDTPVTISLNGNDVETAFTNLTFAITQQPVHGTLSLTGSGPANWVYAPALDFNGPDSFLFTITDRGDPDNCGVPSRDCDGPATSAPGTVDITVVPVDDLPAAVGDAITVLEDSGANALDVLANDTDVDEGPINISQVTQPANGSVTNNGNDVTYTPNLDFCNNGDPTDDFTYTLDPGGAVGTVQVTVTCVNDDPVAVNNSYTTSEDVSVIGNVITDDTTSGVDSDVEGDALTVDGNTIPANGTVVVSPDGSFTYTPNPNFNGLDSFDYTIADGNGGAGTATVDITVVPVDDPPVAVGDAITVLEDSGANALDVLANDADVDGGAINISQVTQPANGSVTNNGNDVTYTPNPDFCNNGDPTDDFTYTLGPGGSVGTVQVTVTCVNDDPVAVNNSYTTDEDVSLSGNVITDDTTSGVDSDVEGDALTVAGNTSPANGTVVVNADGSFTYTPNLNFNGTDSFDYTVADGNGGAGTATVNITINPVNDSPVAVNNSYTTDEDGAVSGNVITDDTTSGVDNDVEGDALTVTEITSPANGTVVVNADGSFTYTPNPNFNGSDSFDYTVADGNGGAGTATVNITVNPVFDPLTVVLTWGPIPTDLDAHLWLPADTQFHVYYNRHGNLEACPSAELDVDVRDSFGPEIISIAQAFPGDYLYAVHNYSHEFIPEEDVPLTASQAQVEVFDPTGLIATFSVSTEGAGFWWNVLTIDGTTGNITPVDQIGANPEPYFDTDVGCGVVQSATTNEEAASK